MWLQKTIMVKSLLICIHIYWISILWNTCMIRIVKLKFLRCHDFILYVFEVHILKKIMRFYMYWWERCIIKSCTHNWALIKILYAGQSANNSRVYRTKESVENVLIKSFKFLHKRVLTFQKSLYTLCVNSVEARSGVQFKI